MPNSASLSIRLYRWLARAFPEEFRHAFAEPLNQASEEIIRDAASRRGWLGLLPVFADLLFRLSAEHLRDLSADLRYALRQLRNSPGFALTAILSLTIGIGMTTSMYSQFRSTIFRSLPAVAQPATLLTTRQSFSYPNYKALRDSSGQWQSLAAYLAPVPFALGEPGRATRVWGHLVSDNYFQLLGLHYRFSDAPAAVISHRLWKNHFASERNLPGKTIYLNGQPITVLAVAPEEFLGASPMMMAADVWIPVTAQKSIAPELASSPLEDRKVAAFHILGRLNPGLDSEQAETAMDGFLRRQEQQYNDPGKERKERRITLLPGGRLVPIRDQDLPAVSGFALVLAGLMLWIAGANVGNLLLARSAFRSQEIATRLAMGAGRSRIIRQLITESSLIAILGGIGAVAFAWWSMISSDAVLALLPEYTNLTWIFDWETYAVSAAVGLLLGILCGLAPALQASRVGLAPMLKEGAAARLRRFRWWSARNMLVFQQVAGSLALLLVTGFIVLGFARSSSTKLGFEPAGLHLVSIDPLRDGLSAEQTRQLISSLPDQLRLLPEVHAASLSLSPPFGAFGAESVTATDVSPGGKIQLSLRTEQVGAGFFETAGIPILAGRAFHPDDHRRPVPVTIVNQKMAAENWPGQHATGRTIELEGVTHEVIGVASNVRSGFAMDLVHPGAYRLTRPADFLTPGPQGVILLLRTPPGVDAAALLRRHLARTDPRITVFNSRSAAEVVQKMNHISELTMMVYGGMGLFSLILAVIGLAGVTAYAVAQRSHEIGIRVALGATRLRILRLVMREGAALVITGLVTGMAMAISLTKLLASFVDGLTQALAISTSDPLLLAGAPLLLALLTLAACYIPARRAARIDPVAALRRE
ncbi:MAG: FtsX-like permease family protein [Acidimicrobiia bacterium]|nr:FtsX-like permease family protein [Acidimicrobiia bacterium]